MLTHTCGPTIVHKHFYALGVLSFSKTQSYSDHKIFLVTATLGCSRCLMSFPTVTVHFGQKPDYYNFDCRFWMIRDGNSHKAAAKMH